MRVCRNGSSCKNPLEWRRPTALRSRSGICAYCSEAEASLAETSGRILGAFQAAGSVVSSRDKDGQQKKESKTEGARELWSLIQKTYIPEDPGMSLRLRRNLEGFFVKKDISDETKALVRDYLKTMSPTALVFTLGAARELGTARIKRLWEAGFEDSTAKNAPMAKETSISTTLSLDTDHDSLVAYVDAKNQFVIAVNPIFVSILTDDAIVDCIAHEYYHHQNGHYDFMDEVVDSMADKDDIDSRRLRELANHAIDVVTNSVLGIDALKVDLGEEPSTRKRLSFLAAAAAGEGLCETNGSLEIQVITAARIERELGLKVQETSEAGILKEIISHTRQTRG